MAITVTLILAAALIYALLSIGLAYLVQRYPRQPVEDRPDWGRVEDFRVPAVDGGELEAWRVTPEGPSRGTVVFMHGWGRNRDRMVSRARVFGRLGYTCVLFSARDHGRSSSKTLVHPGTFAEDIEAVLAWLEEGPVVLYGHSAGSGGAAIAAARNPHRVQRLILEGSFPFTREALLHLYKWANRIMGVVFGRVILFWMDLYFRGGLDRVSPARLAPGIRMPVLLIHGERDRRFPVAFAHRLQAAFPAGGARLFVAPGARHSESSRTPGYGEAVEAFLADRDPSP
jgi:pimeloyl-ACP methyl ester carboxylesterase